MRRRLALLILLSAATARADEAFDGTATARGAAAVRAPRTEVLLSLAALASPGGFGALATLSVPLERVAAPGKVASYTVSAPPLALVTPEAARDAVAAAWRAAGLGAGDGLDSMAARARWSALLPEARVRVLKHMSDTTHSTSTASDPETGTFYASGDALLFEGRLTWRLDRLLFADEEPSIERLRLERAEARAKLAARVTEQLSRWQRALVDAGASAPGTADHTDALLRGVEAATALDVMTDGWFSRTRGRAATRDAETDDGPR